MTVTSLLMRRPSVKRADGVEPVVPPITGLISKRVKPNNLLVARWAAKLAGAERVVAFAIEEVIESVNADLPSSQFVEYSPFNPA